MSHAEGRVIRDGKVAGYFEYNGTVDVVCSRINATGDELDAHWRGDNFTDCTCGDPSVDVMLWTSYGSGGGCYWPGRACFKCMAITGGFDPYGFPDSNEIGPGVFTASEWPKDGYPAAQEDERAST